ncbi:hypothetical protein EJB05_01457, partial [Eragrostis curvula]
MGGGASSSSLQPPDDIVLEILLRVPPEPIYLLRASLVCKKWRRLVHDPAFLRQFRARRRRAPPLVGFFYPSGSFLPAGEPPDRVAAAHFSEFRGGGWRVFGSRHGRVLLSSSSASGFPGEPRLLVWDPMTGDRSHLPPPRSPHPPAGFLYPPGTSSASYPTVESSCIRAALVCGCAGAGHDGSEEEDCRAMPFRVVLLFPRSGSMYAMVYSSQTGAWGDVSPVNGQWSSISHWEPDSVLVHNEELYWPEGHVEYHNLGPGHSPPRRRVEIPDHSSKLFGYNFKTNWLQHVRRLNISHEHPYDCLQVFKDGYGELGLAAVRGSRLHLFETVFEDEDGDIGAWSEYRDLDLDALLPPTPPTPMGSSPRAPVRKRPVGFDEDGNTIFLETENGVFALHLESLKVDKVLDAGVLRKFRSVASSTMIPYMSFFVAGDTYLSMIHMLDRWLGGDGGANDRRMHISNEQHFWNVAFLTEVLRMNYAALYPVSLLVACIS